jgi:hypothetical protein
VQVKLELIFDDRLTPWSRPSTAAVQQAESGDPDLHRANFGDCHSNSNPPHAPSQIDLPVGRAAQNDVKLYT